MQYKGHSEQTNTTLKNELFTDNVIMFKLVSVLFVKLIPELIRDC